MRELSLGERAMAARPAPPPPSRGLPQGLTLGLTVGVPPNAPLAPRPARDATASLLAASIACVLPGTHSFSEAV